MRYHLTMENELSALRHSTEHVLMQAMESLYPSIVKAMGPATEEGFYFDFDLNKKISEEDFPKIEGEMRKIINKDLPITSKELSIQEARNLFKNNPYKQEWLDEIEQAGQRPTVYYTGNEFVDLCKGPHIKSTGEIKAFKLLSVAGAYWRGNEKNKMLTRVYGTAFRTKADLDKYLTVLEEAKKRDHRKLGQDLDLYSFHPEAPGDIFWHPNGYTIMKELFQYWREIHKREDYVEVRTPEILTRKAWDQSGHTSFFIEKMYRVLSPDAKEWDMAIKPMNCDGGILIYKSHLRSYKEFPLRMGELGVVHRFESSGEVHGIMRPREFTQDDAHIYCTPNQVKDELKKVVDLCFEVYEVFGLKLDHLELSTRPKRSIGSEEVWKRAESIMKQVLKEKKVPHQINVGEGAFYGPKFDFHLKDAIGRTWQCSTIQLDFAQPENFQLEYVTEKGTKERPVMIHRVLYGSVERFLGILIEHFAGAFPAWLSPTQVTIIPISERQNNYAKALKMKILKHKMRVWADLRNETMQNKIRNAQMQKVPYMLIIGGKEEKAKTVSIKLRNGESHNNISLTEFTKKVQEIIKEKSLKLW